ncbi:MvdC/MvdD family ATP grasp protein [Amycolatopsis taiwanensis]|uniref:MvdC/MvdD family ATP grasp protein n=1 Tax=Amycolatopsis taiwanensis TaxID=342230 RepID=UPI00047F30D8|nr:hypothetical protein [Amycolatopsis taiwanensis]
MSVLILAAERDPSADTMVLALETRRVEVHRIDTSWFPTQLSLSAQLRGGRWAGHLRTPHRTIDLEEIHAVWYRSPRAYRFSPELNSAEREHAKVEAKYGLGGVLMSLPARWVNHPARLADSAYKPFQLAVAARCGLRVADTLITNRPASVEEFATEGPAVTKMLGAISIVEGDVRKFAHTAIVDEAALRDIRGIEHTYGALDFVIGPDDTWTFLEINAAGQYGWIEVETGAPLTDQLADLLTKGTQ